MADHFVGRQDSVERLTAVLAGKERASGKLTVLSVEGPGGIGKSRLFEHVLTNVDLAERKFLTLSIDGQGIDSSDPRFPLEKAVAKLIESARGKPVNGQIPSFKCPKAVEVISAIESIRSDAINEFSKEHPNDVEDMKAFNAFLDLAIGVGERLDDLSVLIKNDNMKLSMRLLALGVPLLKSLREQAGGDIWGYIDLDGSVGLKNKIRKNALQPLSEALVADFTSLLTGYWKSKEIDRLLLKFDDYEALQGSIGAFLVAYLLPALQACSFESTVVILGRDQLEATHAGWDQHLRVNTLKPIALKPLTRSEMDQLVEKYGVSSAEEKERACRDTQGYPFCVQLWIDEAGAGGGSALMLKKLYARITRWMDERQRRWLDNMLFLKEVNIRTLREMLGSQAEAESAFQWFAQDGSIRDTEGKSFTVREFFRSRLSDYLQICDPDRFDELKKKASKTMPTKTQAEAN